MTLAPGASQTFTATAPITGPVTNTVTATGTSPDATAATATTEATVTGQDCTITLTKTASATETCDGSTVTYDLTVTNDSDNFTWSGTVSDPLLGVTQNVTLVPGESRTLTPSGVVTGVTTNTATATGRFTNLQLTQANATASTTVTGRHLRHQRDQDPEHHRGVQRHDRDLHLRGHQHRRPAAHGQPRGRPLGDIDGGAGVTLAPGASQTFTATAPITGTVTNTVTATGTSPAAPAATATTEATVTGHVLHHQRRPRPPAPATTCDGSHRDLRHHGHQQQRQLHLERHRHRQRSWASPRNVTLVPGESTVPHPLGRRHGHRSPTPPPRRAPSATSS